VRAGGGWVEADRCVVAVPACVLDAIRFAPALPDWKVAALGRVAYGHAAKLVVPLQRSSGPSSVLSSPTTSGRGPPRAPTAGPSRW
jgi:Flavin containing amine oxidoreductase